MVRAIIEIHAMTPCIPLKVITNIYTIQSTLSIHYCELHRKATSPSPVTTTKFGTIKSKFYEPNK